MGGVTFSSWEESVLCVKCGSENEAEAKVCARCGALLPRYLEEEEAAPAPQQEPIHERLQIFEEAVAKLQEGTWSLEEFSNFLTETAAVLAEKERGIKEIEIPEEAAADFQEELRVGFAGIELYNRGIESMFAYLEAQDPQLLEEGLDSIRQGNERINEAMRINRANRDKLEEACGASVL